MDSTVRFTNRVGDYARYRPGYPDEVVATLKAVADLSSAAVVADVGSGTGISTALFLAEGCETFAVEPNAAMRDAACRRFDGHPRFRSIDGRAERTTLETASVDFVTVAQAFHWFDLDATRAEFVRILRPQGWLALFWNDRRTNASAFLSDYEALVLESAPDYTKTHGRNLDARDLRRFFGGDWRAYTFPNEQVLDFEGLRGRLLSSSYAPLPGHSKYDGMIETLRRIFETYEEHGHVRFPYDTHLCLASVSRS